MEQHLSRWQKKWLDHFDDDLYIACTSISAGKTRVLAIWIVLQCCEKAGLRGIIIAQTHAALRKVLIHDILMFATSIGVHIDYNKSSQELKFNNGSILFGYSSENANGVLGLSEIDLLAIDEAAYCSEEIYNYSRDRMRGGKYKPMVRLISSPSTLARVQNWFSKVVKENPDKVVTATYRDNPFTSEEFKKELEDRYVVGSNLFRQQCLGEIFDTDVASQIVFRSDFVNVRRDYRGDGRWIGADMSGLGCDNDAFVVVAREGMVEWKLENLQDTFQKYDSLSGLWRNNSCSSGCIDNTGGYGQGTLDLALSHQLELRGVNFAEKAANEALYPQIRTEMYLELANEIKHGFWVCDEVRDELLAQSVFINGKGQQQLMPKSEVKKIIGHSPDLCDALALAVYAMNHGSEETQRQDEAERARQFARRYRALADIAI